MQVQTYKEVKAFEYSNMIVRVHIPDLTDDKRARRMKEVYRAAESLLRSQGRRVGA